MKTENHRVLIIDDERPVLMTLEALLKRHGYQVETAPTGAQGLKVLKSKSTTLVLLDLRLPDADGLEMLDRIKTELPNVQVIILTAHDSLHNAIESIKRGAYHFISKPYAPEELLSLVEKALEKQFLLRQAEHLRARTEQLEKRLEIAEARPTPIFKSKPMQEIEELIDAMAPSDANVLIVGESGVGKEVIANAIHEHCGYRGPRQDNSESHRWPRQPKAQRVDRSARHLERRRETDFDRPLRLAQIAQPSRLIFLQAAPE